MTLRRILLAAAFVAALAGLAVAEPPVTVVLTNGQQFSGTLTYGNGTVALSNNGSITNRWPVRDVAVIQFAPGQPDQQEIQQITQQRTNNSLATFFRGQQVAVALQDGQVITGRLAAISADGNQVTIVDNQNQRDNYLANDIARLYLNPSAASTLYASNGLSGSNAVGTSGQLPSATPRSLSGARSVRVDARSQWTPTGITVHAGDHLAFQASGQIRATSGGMVVGPDGAGGSSPNYPVPTADLGALVGRVGNGQPFLIGARANDVTMPADGELYLGVNDDVTSDNSGTFVVRVGAANTALGTTGTFGQPASTLGSQAAAFTVPANQPWTATGINVNAGDRVVFRVSGQMSWAHGPHDLTGAGGGPIDPMRQKDYPVASLGVGALVGRVGDGQPFAIGASTQPIVMPASGQLFLGINDDYFGDNSGQFTVMVQRAGR